MESELRKAAQSICDKWDSGKAMAHDFIALKAALSAPEAAPGESANYVSVDQGYRMICESCQAKSKCPNCPVCGAMLTKTTSDVRWEREWKDNVDAYQKYCGEFGCALGADMFPFVLRDARAYREMLTQAHRPEQDAAVEAVKLLLYERFGILADAQPATDQIIAAVRKADAK